MGVSGCGKTTVGEGLAAALGWPFDEGDRYHPPAQRREDVGAHPAAGRRPLALAAGAGRADRRARGGGRRSVLACSSLKRAYRDLLRTGAPRVRFLHLHGDKAVLAGAARRRARAISSRPTCSTRSTPRSSRSGPTRTASWSMWRSSPRRRWRLGARAARARLTAIAPAAAEPLSGRASESPGEAEWRPRSSTARRSRRGCAPASAAAAAALHGRHGVVPGLAAVLVGDDPASAVYVRNKGAPPREAGMHSRGAPPAGHAARGRAARVVARAQRRPGGARHPGAVAVAAADRRSCACIDAIAPEKDVDGFHAVNAGRLAIGPAGARALHAARLPDAAARPARRPRGARGGRRSGARTSSASRWRSCSSRESCTVTVAHSRTRDLAAVCRRAESSSPPSAARGSSPPTGCSRARR